jgi:hypothetical protein
MLTRSVAKGLYWRVPCSSNRHPVLDVILRNIQYENENENENNTEVLTQRDIASVGVQNPSVLVDVIEVCWRRLMQQRFRKRMFVAQITELLETDLPGSEHIDRKRAHIFRFMGRSSRKQGTYMWGDPVLWQTCPTTFENYIEFVNNTYLYFDPVFRTRVAAY